MPKQRGGEKIVSILAIEDSPTQLEALRFLLEESGYAVIVATNGEEGLVAIKSRAIDLVISDIVMPRMDGYAFCRALRSDASVKDLPVILLTSLADPRDVIQGLESGANNFICKPYDDLALLARIQNVLTNQEIRKASPSEMGISIFFSGQRFFITADRLQILDLLLSTYENAVDRNTQLIHARDELRNLNEGLETRIAERTAALATEVSERRQAQEREHKLNLTLHAIREINQLIAKEKDQSRLVEQACAILVDKRGYVSATVALEGLSGRPGIAASAGIDGIGEGEAFIVPIQYDGVTLGRLEIEPGPDSSIDEDENSFLGEVADDLGLALHLIAIERRNTAYAQIVETHPDAMALIDLNEIYEEVNPAYSRLVTLGRDEIAGKSLTEILGPEFYLKIRPYLERCFKGEQVPFDITWEMPGANIMYIEGLLVACHAEDGAIFSASVTLRDITARRQAEEDIKEQLDELKRWQDLMLDREDHAQELKREVNTLCKRLGEAERYPSQIP